MQSSDPSLSSNMYAQYLKILDILDSSVGCACYKESGHPIDDFEKYEDRIVYDLRRIVGMPKNPPANQGEALTNFEQLENLILSKSSGNRSIERGFCDVT